MAANKTVLITGGAGFFGSILKRRLLKLGFFCVSIDLEKDDLIHRNFTSIVGDIRDRWQLEQIFRAYEFSAVFHLAAILAHAVKDKDFLWTSNVDGTKNVADFTKKYKVPTVIFTSSNCLWGEDLGRPVTESDRPNPVEIYGRSKWEGEKILQKYDKNFRSIIFRCPTIIDYGRLGLLSILFEFIDDNKKVWVVGGGDNKYQFIYARDLVSACVKALDYKKSAIFNIGSDEVKSFKAVYEYIIKKAGAKTRVANLPRGLAIFLMKLAYFFRLSPLGPYQYKMIASNFIFDTRWIKKELKWRPTVSNEEMLYRAYEYYHKNAAEIKRRKNVSAHKQSAKMGAIRLLKWIS